MKTVAIFTERKEYIGGLLAKNFYSEISKILIKNGIEEVLINPNFIPSHGGYIGHGIGANTLNRVRNTEMFLCLGSRDGFNNESAQAWIDGGGRGKPPLGHFTLSTGQKQILTKFALAVKNSYKTEWRKEGE